MNYIKRLLSAALGIALIQSMEAASETKAPYNVLFISIDDLRTELNCYGADHIKSPNIDRLATSGMRFTSAHVQQAICMASRASIMTGVRPERHGMYTGESVADTMPGVLTLNRFFKRNGYTISSCGKIYHYPEDTKEQFGDAYMEPKPNWFGRGYVTEESKKIKEDNPDNVGPAYECGDVSDETYKDGANTALAVAKLAELKDSGKPFFMAFGLSKPHLPFVAPKKYWDLYPEDSISLTDLQDRPSNSFKYTVRSGGELGNYAKMPQQFADIDDNTARTLRRGYYACVSYADAQVGKLLDQLDALGLSENTIVVLWGDHGFKLGDYGSWCKWSNMTMDTNIPLLVRVPNGAKGATCTEMVEALDLYPTLADLCGLKQPDHLDGKSIKPLLTNPESRSPETRYAYTVWPESRWSYDRTVMGYSVKTERFNYVEWIKISTGESIGRELYDHSKDPKETRNVIGNPEYATVVATLAAQSELRKKETDHDHPFKKLR